MSWESWRPSSPVGDLAELSESDKEAVREAQLAQLAAGYGLSDPPKVQLERWIRPEELGPISEKCFGEAGFEVRSTPDGQGYEIITQVGKDQRDALHLTAYTCTARFFIDPRAMQPLTHDQLRIIHEFFGDFMIPCLRRLGYTPTDPPTLETFIATYSTTPWSPLKDAGVNENDVEAWDEIVKTCHQGPPAAALYGE